MRVSNTRLPTILACGVCLAVVAISTSPVDAGSSSSGNTHALVLSGISKDAQERQIKDKAVANLRDFLLREAQVKPNRLAVLVADNSLVRNPTATSSAESLTRAIGTFAQAVQPADRFLFYYVGQANVVTGTLRLNLPGPDVTHEQLGKWLGAIRATSMLVVLDCPGAAVACKAVAGPNRVVICAATEGQLSSTRFSEYFVPALTDSAGDRDDDGRISILEAFTPEIEVVDLVFQGVTTNQGLADHLGISVPGAKLHVRNLCLKTDSPDKATLILRCLEVLALRHCADAWDQVRHGGPDTCESDPRPK